MKAKICKKCNSVPLVKNTHEDVWAFECKCKEKNVITMCGYNSKERVIEAYNRLYNSIVKETVEDLVIEIRVSADNTICISSNDSTDDWKERIENSRSKIIKAMKTFAK